MQRKDTMRLIGIWIIFTIILMSTYVSAVNTLCISTNTTEGDVYKKSKDTVNKVKNALDDIFAGTTESNLVYPNGRHISEILMDFQKYQPTFYFTLTHGDDNPGGTGLLVGTNADEWVTATDFNDHHYTAGKTGINYAALPFSTIMLGACKSALNQDGNTNWRDIILKDMYCWNMWGGMVPLKVNDAQNFLKEYATQICKKSRSYYDAWQIADDKAKDSTWSTALCYWSSGGNSGLAHYTCNDVYNYMVRVHKSDGGGEINNGNSEVLTYVRDWDYWENSDTNGAYVVLHGEVGPDHTDTTKAGQITLTIEKETWDGWVQISSDTYNVQNRKCEGHSGGTQYGGSDIVSRKITASTMADIGEWYYEDSVRVTASWSAPSGCSFYLDRFELMEIGD